MEWLDNAIILELGSFRESDVWVKLLTSQHGVISAFAFGGHRSRRRFCGCLGILNEIQVRVQTSRNGRFLNLQEASLINGPIQLRTNKNRFGAFINCIRFLEVVGVSSDAAPPVYTLMKELFYFFEKNTQPYEIIPILFRLRIASEQGYAPIFSNCAKCGRLINNKGFFGISDGIIVCSICINYIQSPIAIGYESLELLKRVQLASPYDWKLSENTKSAAAQKYECTEIINAFVEYHLGITWSKGRFLKV